MSNASRAWRIPLVLAAGLVLVVPLAPPVIATPSPGTEAAAPVKPAPPSSSPAPPATTCVR